MNIEAPLVTIVITTYNYERYLPESVTSVLDQTYKDFELIIVDDGSTDNTPEVVSSYLTDPRVRYYQKPRGGQASAKNFGIDKGKGSLISFLDADDVWDIRKLEKQIPLFNSSPRIGVVYSNRTLIDKDGKESPFKHPQFFRGHVFNRIIIKNFICFSSSVVRRECLERHGRFDETLPMAIDYDLWIRIADTYLFDFVDEPLVKYRVGHGHMSEDKNTRFDCVWKVMKRYFKDPYFSKQIPLWVKLYAKSDTYASMANYYETQARRKRCLYYYIKSLINCPLNLVALKGIIKSVLPHKIESLLKHSD